MIVNTEIKSGFAHVSRVGKYFTLISAAGLVRVVLKLAGAVKLDTKMWVGMSFNAPIDFDEIVIYGDDAAVEFWAGNISMHQSRSSIQGATAIRTSNILLNGDMQLTGSDLLRQSVRIRSDKDIAIFGAGVGSGWAVKAGELEDIPVSGVVRGFKRIPIVDMSKTVLNDEGVNFWGTTSAASRPFYWVSPTGNMRFYVTAQNLWWSYDGGAWEKHPQFDDAFSDYMFAQHLSGDLYMMKKDTDFVSVWVLKGAAFQLLVPPIDVKVMADNVFDWSKHIYNTRFVGDKFSTTWVGGRVEYDVVTGQFAVIKKQDGEKTYRPRVNITEQHIFEVEHNGYSTSRGKVKRSFDGGQTWSYDPLYTDMNPSYLSVDVTGQYVVIAKSSDLYFSNDYGATFKQTGGYSFYGSGAALHVAGGVWVFAHNGKVYGAQLTSEGVAIVEAATLAGLNQQGLITFLRSDGRLYVGSGLEGAELQLSIDGDLAPAKIEIMELLS